MRESVQVDGRTRTFTSIASPQLAAGAALILAFHGSRQTGEGFRRFTGGAFDALAGGGDAMVVYLDGFQGQWNDARRESYFAARAEGVDDVAFTRAVVAGVRATHRIDPGRVFAVGYSNGGQFVMRLIHEAPDVIAGAAIVAATMPAPDNLLLSDPVPPPVAMPVLLAEGTKDPIVPYAGGRTSWWAHRLFKIGGETLSAPATARYFGERNGISAQPVASRIPAARSSRTWVEQVDYRQPGRPPVRLLTVHGGGHTVPGAPPAPFPLGRTTRDVSAAHAVADFFSIAAAPAQRG